MSLGRWAADLEQAERLMHGSGPVGHQSLRMVCWLLRSVLEQSSRELVGAQGGDLGSSSHRAALICLRALYDESAPELADDAEAAWTRLSRAVHHHAYELSPNLSEVEDLMRQVTHVTQFAARHED